ncbi:F-box/FBD/LRR-repeat protein At1g13570-like [Castanea sativa]|uniref:F-box/FBD/LRR-repeat protein At1g13570-like n=1 Tax=Castanea sativa TaxID=21020 RepID=UPI003F6542D5
MTRNKASTSDRISNLPTEIIENILLRLPLRDTVKACALSKDWNGKWKTVPQIVFDESFCTQYPRSYNMRETLFNCMDQIVHIHKKPITKFALSIPRLESFCPVYLLLDRLHKDTLQDFTLWISKGVVLILFLYTCLQLRHLRLSHCHTTSPPTTFKGFKRLVTLELHEVNTEINIFESFISDYPLLEHLTLINCPNTENLDLDAPNLKYLYFEGPLNSIRFRNTPVLASVTIKATEDFMPKPGEFQPADMIKVFRCLPVIEDLFVGDNLLMSFAAGNIPDRLPATLEFLKTVVLSKICFGSLREVSCALCLIRSSPNLQKLKLNYGATADENAAVEFLETLHFLDISLKKLREVEMLTFDDSKPVMAFAKLLLVKSPLLEKMYIQLKKNRSTKRFKILKEVIRFPRASSIAEIIC